MASTLARRLALLAIIALLGACAGLGGRVENPRVTVTSLRVLPAEGVEQRVEVGLRLLNPNDFDLDAKGLVISLGINDVPLLNGATADVPLVPAYGEALTKVTLSVNLVSGLRLVSRLVQRPDDPLQYRLEARLDLRSPMWKRLTVMEQGEISPRPPASVNDSTNRGNTF
ncbi:MAG: LEA type 2 family protein [Pseudomonadales bacterium]|jgi:LEA14-like dessication related protein|nr:LEA type 2 family protein [Pseudomonadales bacterium]MBP9033303.1 LEA type 2 family protein [Pseudomonadales bacterium]